MCEESNKVSKVKWRSLYTWLLVAPPLLIAGYVFAIIFITWPIQELSVDKAGVFGDSFGVLNALFSGLAFAGVIITMLLQKEQLELQLKELIENREQFARSATAQEDAARLSALSALLIEYKQQLAENEQAISKSGYRIGGDKVVTRLQDENTELLKKKNELVEEIENILQRNIESAKS